MILQINGFTHLLIHISLLFSLQAQVYHQIERSFLQLLNTHDHTFRDPYLSILSDLLLFPLTCLCFPILAFSSFLSFGLLFLRLVRSIGMCIIQALES